MPTSAVTTRAEPPPPAGTPAAQGAEHGQSRAGDLPGPRHWAQPGHGLCRCPPPRAGEALALPRPPAQPARAPAPPPKQDQNGRMARGRRPVEKEADAGLNLAGGCCCGDGGATAAAGCWWGGPSSRGNKPCGGCSAPPAPPALLLHAGCPGAAGRAAGARALRAAESAELP